MNNTPSRAARIAAGFALHQVAKQTGLSPRTLRQWESSNKYPYHRAEALSRIYNCRIDIFLPQQQVNI